MIAYSLHNNKENSAFNEFYEKYKNYVFKISFNILGNTQDAEDNTQDVFVYVFNNLFKFDGLEASREKGLLSLITSSIAKNNLRYNSRHNLYSLSYDAENIPEPVDDSSFNIFDITNLSIAIDSLPEEYKIVLYFSYIYGYKSSEIAALLKISDALVRKRLQLAKRELFKIMGE